MLANGTLHLSTGFLKHMLSKSIEREVARFRESESMKLIDNIFQYSYDTDLDLRQMALASNAIRIRCESVLLSGTAKQKAMGFSIDVGKRRERPPPLTRNDMDNHVSGLYCTLG